jgi:hypothetical protein
LSNTRSVTGTCSNSVNSHNVNRLKLQWVSINIFSSSFSFFSFLFSLHFLCSSLISCYFSSYFSSLLFSLLLISIVLILFLFLQTPSLFSNNSSPSISTFSYALHVTLNNEDIDRSRTLFCNTHCCRRHSVCCGLGRQDLGCKQVSLSFLLIFLPSSSSWITNLCLLLLIFCLMFFLSLGLHWDLLLK